MARGKTLTRLLDELRHEMRLSTNPAHNSQVRDAQVMLLQREQERLWEDFDWPHLRVERLIPVVAGQRYYAPPDDLSVDRIEHIEFKTDNVWHRLGHGVGPSQYAAHDSTLDQRAWPVRRWRSTEDGDIEVWPIADQDAGAEQYGYLKLIGIRNLKPLVDESDIADLDNRLLVLYCAGSMLAASGAKDAQLKLEAANSLYAKLKGNQVKTGRFTMFGATENNVTIGPFITRYRPPET